MSRVGRLSTAAAIVTAAAALPLAVAAPAHAAYDECVAFLAQDGHSHPEDLHACRHGAAGELRECFDILVGHGVVPPIAHRACLLAARP